eukprot:48037-Chlamydomonas_euryale.AAC.1
MVSPGMVTSAWRAPLPSVPPCALQADVHGGVSNGAAVPSASGRSTPTAFHHILHIAVTTRPPPYMRRAPRHAPQADIRGSGGGNGAAAVWSLDASGGGPGCDPSEGWAPDTWSRARMRPAHADATLPANSTRLGSGTGIGTGSTGIGTGGTGVGIGGRPTGGGRGPDDAARSANGSSGGIGGGGGSSSAHNGQRWVATLPPSAATPKKGRLVGGGGVGGGGPPSLSVRHARDPELLASRDTHVRTRALQPLFLRHALGEGDVVCVRSVK